MRTRRPKTEEKMVKEEEGEKDKEAEDNDKN